MWDDELVTLVRRWIMGAKRGDGQIVDHFNGDRLDDRRLNLRFVSAAESSANVKAPGMSGFRGVYRSGGKWSAAGKVGGRIHYLGMYNTPEEAAQIAHLWRLENLPGLHRQGYRGLGLPDLSCRYVALGICGGLACGGRHDLTDDRDRRAGLRQPGPVQELTRNRLDCRRPDKAWQVRGRHASGPVGVPVRVGAYPRQESQARPDAVQAGGDPQGGR